MVNIIKDQMSFDLDNKELLQPKPKNVAHKQGKNRRRGFTREESAHILGMKYEGMDDRDE